MKTLLSSRGLFALGFVILVATNIGVLYGVASNRSGAPETQITLTDRELQLPYQVHEENSGLTLRLVWRSLGNTYPDWRSPVWFSAKKLEELGFNINYFLSSKDHAAFYKQSISKEVFIVLENAGQPYREAIKKTAAALEKAENLFKLNPANKRLRDNFTRAEKRLKRRRITETRLYAIDAGLDYKKLRDKYEDRTRFIITKGLVKAKYKYNKKKKEVFGYITKLSVARIHVPLKYRKIFDTILIQNKPKKNKLGSARYEVELAYGTRLEPWILSVKHRMINQNEENEETKFQ